MIRPFSNAYLMKECFIFFQCGYTTRDIENLCSKSNVGNNTMTKGRELLNNSLIVQFI